MFDREDLLELEFDDERMRKEYAPSKQDKIKSFTVACLILNRSIGSGIFATPANIIRGTNSIGISLLFWSLGGLLAFCGTLVWLEFGLSIPREHVEGKDRAVPRSGGEKNYLEWVLRRPKFLGTCMYGIVFIILGNLSGNAIAFGRYVLWASGQKDPQRGPVIGIAIAALTLVALLHAFSRRGGILVNNIFAVVKTLLLLVIIIVGFATRAGADFNGEAPRSKGESFKPSDAFNDRANGLAAYSSTFLYVIFTYSGFEQPFYVLSEVDRPRRNFGRAVLSTIGLLTALFVLVNVAYVCVIPKSYITDPKNSGLDIASMFFELVFGHDTGKRVVQAFIAVSILGNLIVMTFTAARVKQEIAKEGILPKSLFWATGKTTPTAKLLARWRRRGKKNRDSTDYVDGKESLEQSPMAALFLHWISSLVLIAVTAKLKPNDSYNFLVSLYAYVIISVMGFFTSLGLLYAKYIRKDFKSEYAVWGGPTAAIIFCVTNAFFLITAFLPAPAAARISTLIPTWVVPTIGLSTVLWGVVWWLGLQLVMRRRGQRLVVTRTAFCDRPDEKADWVLKYEIIDHVWMADSEAGSIRSKRRSDSMEMHPPLRTGNH